MKKIIDPSVRIYDIVENTMNECDSHLGVTLCIKEVFNKVQTVKRIIYGKLDNDSLYIEWNMDTHYCELSDLDHKYFFRGTIENRTELQVILELTKVKSK